MSLLMIGAGALSGQRSKAQAAEQKAQAALQPKAQTIFGAKLKSVDVARNTVTVATVNPVNPQQKRHAFCTCRSPNRTAFANTIIQIAQAVSQK